jgi:ribosome maturation factor RimP
MSKVKKFNKRSFQNRLRRVLSDNLDNLGLTNSDVSVQSVPHTDVVRVFLKNSKFKSMPQMERQELVWRILDEKLPDEDEKLHISTVLTLTPEEAEGE